MQSPAQRRTDPQTDKDPQVSLQPQRHTRDLSVKLEAVMT